MKLTPNLVVGVVITLVGSALVLDRLGLMEFRSALQLWPVLLTLFGLSVTVQALRPVTADDRADVQRPIVGPGLVLFLAVVGFLGWRSSLERPTAAADMPADSSMSLVGIMSQDRRASAAPDFGRASMVSVMGSTRLDLRKAGMTSGRDAVVAVVGVMGGVEIYVPSHWIVDVKAIAVMGGITDQRAARPPTAETAAPNTPKLVVTGMVLMGGLVIKS